MYILFIDDWLYCIGIASVVQWSALCLTHWRPRLNFCGKHNIFNFKRNAIMSIVIYNLRHNNFTNLSGKWRELWAFQWAFLLETGVQVRLMSSVGKCLSLFHANYNVKYNDCVVFIWCLDGALISSEVSTLNSSGSDPCKNVDRGTAVVFYRTSWKNHKG